MSLPIPRSAPAKTAPRYSPEHDDDLVERIASSDEAAFEQLFATYYQSLCHFVLSLFGSPHVAEDLVQGVFLRIWERRRTWDPTGGVRAYLFASCRNAALDHARHENLARRTFANVLASEDVPALGTAGPGPAEVVERNALADAIRSAVAEMPERRRAVATMRWQHQLGPTEIARVLGISVKGVEDHLARAAMTLRQRLANYR